MTRWSRSEIVLAVIVLGFVVGRSPTAGAWGTPEHVFFGEHIADPFEDALGEPGLPVFTCDGQDLCMFDNGPITFGDWVSAPDFSRSLERFLFIDPSTGPVACAKLWIDDAQVDGVPLDDQTLAEGAEDTSWSDKIGIIDCVDSWAVNNNHFGDFAAQQYVYYHHLALEAARRYRGTRNSECRKAAYTLEGWGLHYLTDSTASGHGWNPPGSYDSDHELSFGNDLGVNIKTGVGIRMRIHDFLNENGAHMVTPLDSGGTVRAGDELWWGDSSNHHTHSGQFVPHIEGNVQRSKTLRLSRIGLGQVVAATECGAEELVNVFHTTDERNDPRRYYANDRAMCKAMAGHEVDHWFLSLLPDSINLAGLDHPTLLDRYQDCKDEGGDLITDPDGALLATSYFMDKFSDTGAAVSILRDPKSITKLEALGCDETSAFPPAARTQHDSCGNAQCRVPIGPDGSCPDDMAPSGGCCEFRSLQFGFGDVVATPFELIDGGGRVELGASDSVPGGAVDFLWHESPPIDVSIDAGELVPVLDLGAQTLAGHGDSIERCGSEASFSVFEARVRGDVADKALVLTVLGMDEGIKVQVNGHVVAYLNSETTTSRKKIELFRKFQPSDEDGDYYLRVTSENACGDDRPVSVALSLETPTDKSDGGSGDRDDDGGCNASSSSSPTPLGAALVVLIVAVRRRSRRTRAAR